MNEVIPRIMMYNYVTKENLISFYSTAIPRVDDFVSIDGVAYKVSCVTWEPKATLDVYITLLKA